MQGFGQLLASCYTRCMIIAVDTGGTKTLVTSFTNEGKMEVHHKFPTPKNTEEYSTLLRNTLTSLPFKDTVEAISIALPGIIENNIALWCTNLGWRNFDIKKQLTPVFKDVPILVENDANLAGLAEARTLQPSVQSALYITVSTGIGTGFITNGHINQSMRHSEGGQMMIMFDGTLEKWESFASGRAMYAAYGEYASEITSNHRWQDIAQRISYGLLSIIPLTQPDIIIFGGSVGAYFHYYEQYLIATLKENLPPYIAIPQLVQARYPEHAVAYGGYHYAVDFLSR